MFTRLLAWLHYSLIDFFIITKWITNTLDICLSWIISRVWSGQSQGVRYWGFLQNSLFEQAARVSPKEFPGVIHFCRRSFCYFSIVWWVLLRFSRPLFLAYCGDSMIFFGNSLKLHATSQEVLSLPSVVIVSWWIRSHGILFFALWRIILTVVFTQFLWGENNIKVTEEGLVLFVKFNYFWLTMSRGDFVLKIT